MKIICLARNPGGLQSVFFFSLKFLMAKIAHFKHAKYQQNLLPVTLHLYDCSNAVLCRPVSAQHKMEAARVPAPDPYSFRLSHPIPLLSQRSRHTQHCTDMTSLHQTRGQIGSKRLQFCSNNRLGYWWTYLPNTYTHKIHKSLCDTMVLCKTILILQHIHLFPSDVQFWIPFLLRSYTEHKSEFIGIFQVQSCCLQPVSFLSIYFLFSPSPS